MNIKQLTPWNWFKNEEASEEKPMILSPWSSDNRSASPVYQLQREVDRLFDNFSRNMSLSGFLGSDSANNKVVLKPNVDIAETSKAYKVTVEVPGVSEEDVKLELADGILTIKGEKHRKEEKKDENFYRVERSYGSFQRTLSLPSDVKESDIDAKFKDGVLTITLPREESKKSKPRQISVKKAA